MFAVSVDNGEEMPEHGMTGGSHERLNCPECRCGQHKEKHPAWFYWDGMCLAQQLYEQIKGENK
jgi:hypothetical protein